MNANTAPSSALASENPVAGALDLQRIFDAAPGCFLVLAPDGPRFTILAVTDAYLHATKTERAAILGKGVFEVFPDNPEDGTKAVDFARASFQRVVDTRGPDVMGIRKHDIRRPQSEGGGFEERFWEAANFPVLGADGQVACIIHRVQNVTEAVRAKQKAADEQASNRELREARRAALNLMDDAVAARRQAEEASAKLRQSEEMRRLAQEIAAVGSFEWNIVTGVNTWTPELEAMYGLPAGGFAGTQEAWEKLVHPKDWARATQAVQRAFETPETVEEEWRVIWPDGSVH